MNFHVEMFGEMPKVTAVKKYGTLLAISAMFAVPQFAAAANATSAESDPWEPVNRQIYQFNETLDTFILKPLANTYNVVLPQFARTSVRNFFYNINDVNVFANNLLQFKFKRAASDSGRLLLNTTVGIGGLFDVATKAGLQRHNEDFGQTLGVWGIGPGPYVMLPLFGASTVRDSIGFGFDTVANPLTYLEDVSDRNALMALRQVRSRADASRIEAMMTGDYYLFIREAYLQQRVYEVSDGQVYDELDDF